MLYSPLVSLSFHSSAHDIHDTTLQIKIPAIPITSTPKKQSDRRANECLAAHSSRLDG